MTKEVCKGEDLETESVPLGHHTWDEPCRLATPGVVVREVHPETQIPAMRNVCFTLFHPNLKGQPNGKKRFGQNPSHLPERSSFSLPAENLSLTLQDFLCRGLALQGRCKKAPKALAGARCFAHSHVAPVPCTNLIDEHECNIVCHEIFVKHQSNDPVPHVFTYVCAPYKPAS